MRPEIPRIDFSKLLRTHSAIIPESYRDEMGHMNVTWYTHLFSEAMGGLMNHLGLSLELIESKAIGGVALEAHIHYLAEVHIGDRVSVSSRVLSRSEKRLHMLHLLRNDTRDQVSALFEGIMACFDLRARRMTPIPPEIAAQIDSIIAEHQNLDWSAPVTGVMTP